MRSSAPMPAAPGDVNLSDFAFWALPVPEREAAFAALRQLPHPPFYGEIDLTDVGFPPGPGYYALVRHADIVEVSRRPQDFCSSKGAISVIDMPSEFNEFFGSMISMDNPKHARLRRIVSRAFSSRAIGELEDVVRITAQRIVRDLIARGPCDFVRHVAARMPITVICDILGIPEEDHDFIFDRSNVLVGAFDPDYVPDMSASATALLTAGGELADYVDRLGKQRTVRPADDLITKLVSANVDGEKLSPQELGSFFILLVVAGNETTRNAISYGLKLLTDNPVQRSLWVSDFETHAARAVEEIVRISAPILYMRRTATRDCEMNGHLFQQDDKLLLFYWSANRDETVFDTPHGFDITRDPNPHLGFGSAGPHFCLGAHLGRLEITEIFRRLLHYVPDIRSEGEPQWLQSNFINGIKRLDCFFS
jgi:methyl-branched lipid omega-hydroxylase